MAKSYTSASRTRAITIRISPAKLKKLMRARSIATQSELLRCLVDEEEERLATEAMLRSTTGTVAPGDLDDHLL